MHFHPHFPSHLEIKTTSHSGYGEHREILKKISLNYFQDLKKRKKKKVFELFASNAASFPIAQTFSGLQELYFTEVLEHLCIV